jgi:heme exporter protein D
MIESGATGGLAEFFAMGGYGFYVWGSYGLFVLVLLWDGLLPSVRARRLLRSIVRREQRETARQHRQARRTT